jgi:hypothetical protein
MSSQTDNFFSPKNEAMLQRVLYTDICRRIGGDLNEKEATRLMKTVKHYMVEVSRVKGDGAPVSALNKEVLQVVLPDYMMYMERNTRTSGRSVISDIETGPPVSAQTSMMAIEDDAPRQKEQLDVGVAFSQLQARRQTANARPRAPEMQDFRLTLADEGPVSIDTFERIKQEREEEAARQQRTAASAPAAYAPSAYAPPGGGAAPATSPSMQNFVRATDGYSRDRKRAEEESEAAYAEIERKQLEARAAAAAESQANLPMPPDMRSLILGDRQSLDRTYNRLPNANAGNSTLAPGDIGRDSMNSRQQMIITREPESMEYKETELNLFAYSGDRDWISNSTETRYNFTVSFDPSNMPVGLRMTPATTAKFRNIVRIELVKAIMPGESLDNLVTRSYNPADGGSFTYSSPYNINVLSFPFIQVRIPELENNNYGTNLGLTASFGVLQYDANWIYDTTNENTRGYLAMIPKFMKCQKTYSPTPLATIQRLTFRFERPDGTLVSTIPDILDINQIRSSKEVAASATNPYGYDATVENGTSAAYYFLNTTSFFNHLTVTKGDRIMIKNVSWLGNAAGDALAQIQHFLEFIEQDGGFIVVDTGYSSGNFSQFSVGSNSQGYCNYIVLRGKFSDPTTGATSTAALGKIADASVPGALVTNTLTSFLSTTLNMSGRLLNQSHQVQVVLRVIVREMDSTSIIRPDIL